MPKYYASILEKYGNYSMVARNPQSFLENLYLMEFFGRSLNGDFVECGTWKGGMSCAMMAVGGDKRHYHFFDSFEGLPAARTIDGEAALHYQEHKESPLYYDNCRADFDEFTKLIHSQGTKRENIHVYKGWFDNTLKTFPGSPIAVLRLDGDWYESTLTCLKQMYQFVVSGGIIILDDYDHWDGCARATHDFLSQKGSNSRIFRTPLANVAYIQKFD